MFPGLRRECRQAPYPPGMIGLLRGVKIADACLDENAGNINSVARLVVCPDGAHTRDGLPHLLEHLLELFLEPQFGDVSRGLRGDSHGNAGRRGHGFSWGAATAAAS